MTPDDFARVEALFDEVVRLPAADRSAWLASRGVDTAVRVEVEALLDAHARVSSTPAAEPDAPEPPIAVGAIVGAYRLIDKIGEGGMGEVYRAERADGAFDRYVAIKITRAAFGGRDALDRFRRERQILATLDHPRIVTLLDGGVTPQGLAYFVMEHVEGVPLNDYCGQRNPSLDDRLQLIRRVCEAVDHAHQHAVVHRDLKPANVLVTSDGFPKVLDFGVAKLVAEQATPDPTAGVLPAPLTPNYASPEQIRGLPVTTASDVYSLGVLLYEVVSGQRPYDTGGRTLDRVLQIVVDTEPDLPSRALGTRTLGHPAYGSRQLRGDIDAIVMKALRKEPDERYASPRDLAEDLARVSRRQPVTARPPSAGYIARRFVARNRTLVTGAALAVVGIVVALGLALWQWQVAREEQARAERRFAEVRQLANRVLFDYQESLRLLRGASDLRARMATDSLAYLDALSAERSDDELLFEMARGYLAIAEVQGSTRTSSVGDGAGALSSLERADTILRELVGRRPDFTPAGDVLAQLGCVAARIDVRRARQHAQRCLDELTPRVDSQDPPIMLALRLGDAHALLVESGDLSHVAPARAAFEPHVDDPSVGRRARLTLALVLRLAARAALERGHPTEALVQAQQAEAVMAPVVVTEPQATRLEQSFNLQIVGRARMALSQFDDGRTALEASLALVRTAYRDNPNDAFIQDRLVLAWFELAAALDPLDRTAVAGVVREAVGMLPSLTLDIASPGRDRARGLLLAAHARLNQPVSSCELVSSAASHFAAARRTGPLRSPLDEYAAWTERAHARCTRTE
jgi:hypothetical protein